MLRRGRYSTDAVVLGSYDYGESDLILVFFTRTYGKLRGIAKGARRSRRRFVGKLDPGTWIRLGFHQGDRGDLVRVEDASLVRNLPALSNDIERLSEAHYLIELTGELTREGQEIPGVFDLLSAFLAMLDSAASGSAGGAAEASGAVSPAEFLRFFEIRLLTLVGYRPHIDGCVVCGAAFEGGPGEPAFSNDLGGAVCGWCRGKVAGRLVPVSAGTLRLLVTAARYSPEKLVRLKPAPAFSSESERMLEGFIRHQIGKELKTRVFMARMRASFA